MYEQYLPGMLRCTVYTKRQHDERYNNEVFKSLLNNNNGDLITFFKPIQVFNTFRFIKIYKGN